MVWRGRTAIDYDTSKDSSVTADPFGRTMGDDVCTQVDRTDEEAWGQVCKPMCPSFTVIRPTSHAKGVVDDERDAVIVSDLQG